MKAYVVGAGLAGLGAATALCQAGMEVEVSEAAAQAGGRCRSYFDPQVGLTIDNGNHLVLSGNQAVHVYLRRIGAKNRLTGPEETEFPFVDLASGERWTVRPNRGLLPWWILSAGRGVPGASFGDYLRMAGLLRPRAGRRVDQTIACRGPVWDRLGLAAAFVEPAIEFLVRHGATVRLRRRLMGLQVEGDRICGLEFSDGAVDLAADDYVVLAVPPWDAAELLPGLIVPDEFQGIVNGHFRVSPPASAPLITGVLNSTVEWIFAFDDRIAVTVSAANRIIGEPREALARRLWGEVAQAMEMSAELPPWQIVKEKRATFAATVEQQQRRPQARTALRQLVLAGDWTATGLPATIEGALRSGAKAAQIVQQETRR